MGVVAGDSGGAGVLMFTLSHTNSCVFRCFSTCIICLWLRMLKQVVFGGALIAPKAQRCHSSRLAALSRLVTLDARPSVVVLHFGKQASHRYRAP